MKNAFIALQAQLLTALSSLGVNYIRMWNNQLERLLNGEISDFALMNESGDTPAILIEFVGPSTIETLGNGDQLYNPFDIKIHILHQFYNASDGTQDQDLKVLDIAQGVYDAFNGWMSGTVAFGQFIRISEEWDYDHPDVYHFIQTYRTTFVDSTLNAPVNGTLSDKNDTLTLNVIQGA